MPTCPTHWFDRRKYQVAEMILATVRGFVVDRLASGHTARVEVGFMASTRALEREEAVT